MKYMKEYTKTVWGCAIVEAKNKKEAEKLFDNGDFDEEDNKSEHEWTSEVLEDD